MPYSLWHANSDPFERGYRHYERARARLRAPADGADNVYLEQGTGVVAYAQFDVRSPDSSKELVMFWQRRFAPHRRRRFCAYTEGDSLLLPNPHFSIRRWRSGGMPPSTGRPVTVRQGRGYSRAAQINPVACRSLQCRLHLIVAFRLGPREELSSFIRSENMA